MLKLTKTGIGLLTKQYRSVLRKCLLLNLVTFLLTSVNTSFADKLDSTIKLIFGQSTNILDDGRLGSSTENYGAAYYIQPIWSSKWNDGLEVTGASVFGNLYVLDRAIGAKIASDGHYIKKSDTNSITANLSALDYALYNYYYTKDEVKA